MQKTVLSKIIAIFWEPSATFRFLLVKTSWLDVVVPVLLVILVTVASIPYVTPIALEDQKDRIAQSERLSDEQKAVFYDQINKQIGSPKAFILSPVVIIVRTALVAAILMFVSNFLFGGEVKYVGMLAVSAYGSLVDLIASAVKIPLIISQQTALIYTGPAILLQDNSTFLFRFAANLDLFAFWKVVIMAIGVGIMAKMKMQKVFWAILTLWLIYGLAAAGLGGLFKV